MGINGDSLPVYSSTLLKLFDFTGNGGLRVVTGFAIWVFVLDTRGVDAAGGGGGGGGGGVEWIFLFLLFLVENRF